MNMNMNMDMDIFAFFPAENATEEEKFVDEYKREIYNLATKGYVTTLQYSYLINFVKTMGTICNLSWLLEQITQIKPIKNINNKKIIKENLNNKEQDENIISFKTILGKVFNNILKYKEETDELRINKNIKYYLTRSDSIDLTNEQKIAMQTLYNFLIDYNQKTMGLYGYAGTGKTTTVVEFVSYMLLNKYLHYIAFTAPTNKALNVIKNKFKPHLKKIIVDRFGKNLEDTFNFDDEIDFLEQKGVVIKFLTIHKLLMFQTDFSLDGTTIFVRDAKNGSMISQFELIVIDECSMISMDMIDNIFEEIRNVSKNNNSKSKGYTHIPKVIFTGDPAQLPPVHEDDSSIFCKNEQDLSFAAYMDAMSFKYDSSVASDTVSLMEYRYKILITDLGKMNTMLLKHVVRSRLDNVTKVCHEFRRWIKSDVLPDLGIYKGKKGVEFFNNDENKDKIRSAWFQKFLSSVRNGETSIIITWTNRQTDIYNETIRRQIFHGKKLLKFEPNDVLMLSEFYGLDLGEDFVKQKLYTSEQIKIISTKMVEVPINIFEMLNNAGLKKLKQFIKIEGMIKTLVDGLNEFYCRGVKFMSWALKVHKFGEEDNHSMTILVVDDTALEKYEKYKSESGLAIKNFSKQILNQYRTSPKQIERCIVKPLWKQWNKIFVDPFANVNYGYSITCHKAQGSSFFDVYIDLDDILKNDKRPIEARKCAYTAATRTINELNILI